MSDTRELREIKLRQRVEHARRMLDNAPPQECESAKRALAAALRVFSRLILDGNSTDGHHDPAVDDDPTFLEQARQILNRERLVFLASDAQHAWRLAQQLGFSVALVDLDLRGEDGLALIEHLHAAFPELAIIAISSEADEHVLQDAKASGRCGGAAEAHHASVEAGGGAPAETAPQ